MDKLKSKKERLCELLSRDPSYILEQCGDILSMNEFKEVQKQSSAPEKMSMLLKIIIEKGGDHCETFWDILRQHQNHYGQLPQLLCSSTQGKDQSVHVQRQHHTRSALYLFYIYFQAHPLQQFLLTAAVLLP
uniref:CARD domain-containing protein n=1 Tax=Echeneis naucrates TaxID=173247 RepID=A0A665VFK8_ECHNA